MDFRLSLGNPDELTATFSITTTVREWRRLHKFLDSSATSLPEPAWTLNRELGRLIARAEKELWANAKAEAESP